MAKPPEGRKTARRPGRPVRASKSNNTRMLLWVILGAAVLIVAGIIILQSQSLGRAPEISGTVSQGLSWGPESAPVKIIEYSNFGCSHCRDFAENQGKQLRQEYEAGGQVRFDFKPFSLGSSEPDDAANAALCAADQGRFWDYHDYLFSQQGVSSDSFGKAALKQYGSQLGLDMGKFTPCVDRSEHLDQVHQTSQEGMAKGVNSTPTFYINGQQVLGAVPYAELKAQVDAALQAAGQG